MTYENANKKWRWLAALCGIFLFPFGLFVMIGGLIARKTDFASWGIYLGVAVGTFTLFFVLPTVWNSDETSEDATLDVSAADSENLIARRGSRTSARAATSAIAFAELKEKADRVTYEEIYRNNETYQGDLVYLKGEVVQVIADGNSDRYVLRVSITRSSFGYDDPVLVHYTGPVRLLDDDIVEIVGNVKGLRTYESTLGGRITIPEITDAHIQLIN